MSFLNYDRSGIPFNFDKNGVTVSGKFDGEIFALYHLGDMLMFMKDYGFVADTMLVYSLPMWLKLPDGMTVKINRNVSEFQRHESGLKWPLVTRKDDCYTVSWFPMYLEKAPAYPAEPNMQRSSAQAVHAPTGTSRDVWRDTLFSWNFGK